MVRKNLLVALLLATAAPLVAQEEAVWSSMRPDGRAPLGVSGGQLLDLGQVVVGYRFTKMNSRGIWLGNDSLTFDETLELYPVAPLTLENLTHEASLAYGATDALTLTAAFTFSQRRREQYSEIDGFYVTDIAKLGDLEVSALYRILDQNAYRAHVQLGAVVPIGSTDVTAETPSSSVEVPLPYDMRPGAGTFALRPGLTAAVQNEFGTVGAQIKGLLYLGTNSEGYSPGDRLDLTGWASYKANESFSVSGRVHYQAWRGIDGADARLNPLQDPGNESYFLKGERVDLPVGVNFTMPEGSALAGHRISLEWIFPVHQEYDAPQLGADWGMHVGWEVVF